MASRILLRASFILVTGIVYVATFGSGLLFGSSGGRTGRTVTGCTCHASAANAGVTVSISGPQQLAPGTTGSYTISVSGNPTQGGGFDLAASGGTLTAGANNHLSSTELTHNDETSRSWPFTWTAPASAGSYNFTAVALAANRDGGTSGDQWNWYGGAASAPFTISVANPVGVDDGSPPALWLGAPHPNPSMGRASVEFSLSAAGPARLEVFDVSGRRIATLLSESLPAGRHALSWNGRDVRGQTVSAGMYLIRLTAEGRELTTRLTRISD